MSVDQFTQAFNTSAKEFQTGLNISKLNVSLGDVNGHFMYVLVDNLSTLNTEDRGSIIRDLGLTDENTDFSNLNQSIVRNGLQYQLQSSDTIGIRFSISEAPEQ